MTQSFPFPMYSGLLSKDHRENIGPAIWEFLWCISKTTKEIKGEDGECLGIVLGGKPVKHAEISEDLGTSERTVKRNMARLKEFGYIETTRVSYGEIINVKKSKKFSKERSAKNGTSPTPDVPEMSLPDVPNMSHLGGEIGHFCPTDVPHMSKRSAKNGTSNKINKINKINSNSNITNTELETTAELTDDEESNEEGMPSPREGAVPPIPETDAVSGQVKISELDYRNAIKEKYILRRNRGLEISIRDEQAIGELVTARVPLRTVLEGIDKAFDEFHALHSHSRISSMQYCLPIIFDLHHLKTSRDSVKHVRQDGFQYKTPSNHDLKDALNKWISEGGDPSEFPGIQ